MGKSFSDVKLADENLSLLRNFLLNPLNAKNSVPLNFHLTNMSPALWNARLFTMQGRMALSLQVDRLTDLVALNSSCAEPGERKIKECLILQSFQITPMHARHEQ